MLNMCLLVVGKYSYDLVLKSQKLDAVSFTLIKKSAKAVVMYLNN